MSQFLQLLSQIHVSSKLKLTNTLQLLSKIYTSIEGEHNALKNLPEDKVNWMPFKSSQKIICQI